MKIDLVAVRDALAGLTDTELHALVIATSETPQIAHGMLAWIGRSCDWELNRRIGRDYGLRPPEAIDPSEDTLSIEAVNAMRESFAASDLGPAALKFFDVLAELLTGGGRKQSR